MDKLKIAIYSRKSIATDTGDSIENQIQRVKNYFSDKDCKFILFEDEGWSGGNDKRPAFQKMIQEIKNNKIDVVAVYMLDRVSRNVVDFVNFYDTMKKHSVKFISVTEGFDFSTPMGKMYMYLLSIFAEMERENISKRVKDNKLFLAKQGYWTGGTAPIGYKLNRTEENGKKVTFLEINQDSKDFVIELYNKYLEFKSYHKIQRWVYDEYGIKWFPSTVKNILTSPIYCKSTEDSHKYLSEKFNVYGNPNGCGYIKYSVKSNESNEITSIVSVSKHLGLIEPKIWIEVQQISKVKPKASYNKSKLSYLTSVLRCDICGSPMTLSYNHTNKDGIRNYYYICTGKRTYGKEFCSSKWINQVVCDNTVLEKLKQLTINKSSFTTSIGEIKKHNLDDDIINIKKNISKRNNILENLTEKMILVEGYALDTVTKKMNDISNEILTLKGKLIELEEELLKRKNSINSIDNLYKQTKILISLLGNEVISIDEKRDLLICLIKEIRWNSKKQSLDITFNI